MVVTGTASLGEAASIARASPPPSVVSVAEEAGLPGRACGLWPQCH